ncbi:MAG: cation:proton antiporter [Phycisphaeraceae bacterium]|nr:cation:proton antiporter [Phycisphaeraceae bacterium]
MALASLMLAADAAESGTAGPALDLLVVLAGAGVVSLALGRLRLAAIPGYLIAGVLLNLVYTPEERNIEQVSHLAVVLLMFGIGLHLDLSHLKRSALTIIGAGVVSTLLSAVLITLLSLGFGQAWPTAIAIGMALSMSSTAVVLRIFLERREMSSVRGRVALGVLITQDLLVVAALAAIPVLASLAGAGSAGGQGPDLRSLASNGLVAVGGIGLFIFAGSTLLPRLLEFAAKVSKEVMLVLAAAVVLSSSMLTTWLKLSPELGAFLAGFLLAGTPFRFQLAGQIAPLRDLFMAVFFTAVGLKINLSDMAQVWWVVLLGGTLVALLKAASIGVSCWLLGTSSAVAIATGFALSQAGEFSLVMQSLAASRGLLNEHANAAVIGVVVVSLILTPGLMALGRRAADRFGTRIAPPPWVHSGGLCDAPDSEGDEEDAGALPEEGRFRVVVAGFGPAGRAVVDRLLAAKVHVTILELNADTVRTQRRLGRDAYYGDATNPEVLDSVGVAESNAFVITFPDDDATLRACRVARSMAPNICIAVRVSALSRALQAKQLGANHVTVEEVATADAMARDVIRDLRSLGIDDREPMTLMLDREPPPPT